MAALLSLPTAAQVTRREPAGAEGGGCEALVRQLEGLARGGPVLVFWEDAHWADPTSLKLLGLTIDRVRALRAPWW